MAMTGRRYLSGYSDNAQQADNLLSNLQNRASVQDPAKVDAMTLVSWNHVADPVGILAGGNPGNYGAVPAGSNTLFEMVKVVMGWENTSHNCYKSSEDACASLQRPTKP